MARRAKVEEADLFSFAAKEEPKKVTKKAVTRKKADQAKKKVASKKSKLVEEVPKKTAAELWDVKWKEFAITHPTQEIKDQMKDEMVKEGFTKREANRVFKGLFFKEKVCNTQQQAREYLEEIPTSYAVKYKIGIPPSPQMVSLARRLQEKKEKLVSYQKAQNERKFSGDFISCMHCKSKVNAAYVKPPLCPVCGMDMRSDHVVETLGSLEKAVADLSKRYEDTARKYNSKFTGGEQWIIRLVNPFKGSEE